MATQTFSNSQFLKQHFGCFGFEVDKAKESYPVTAQIHVKIPADVSDKELHEIEDVLAQTIANSLGCNPEQTKVKVDPKTGETTFVVTTNDPTLADDMQKVLKANDVAETINKSISENSQNLPARIAATLAIDEVNVIFFFCRNNKMRNNNKTKTFHCHNI